MSRQTTVPSAFSHSIDRVQAFTVINVRLMALAKCLPQTVRVRELVLQATSNVLTTLVYQAQQSYQTVQDYRPALVITELPMQDVAMVLRAPIILTNALHK